MNKKFILDVCCGGRLFWFNKKHPNTLYIDNDEPEDEDEDEPEEILDPEEGFDG